MEVKKPKFQDLEALEENLRFEVEGLAEVINTNENAVVNGLKKIVEVFRTKSIFN